MFESVRERDLDHLLLEELHASEPFRLWLLSRIGGFHPRDPSAISVTRSERRESDAREIDLRVDFLDDNQKSFARLLIENKVTADFQFGQAESYGREVARLRHELGVENAAAILVAPSSFAKREGVGCFDAVVTLDEILDWLRGRLASVAEPIELRRRLEVKLSLMERIAGKTSYSEWRAVTIPEKRDFSAHYRSLLSEFSPGFEVSPSSDGPKAITKLFQQFPMKSAFGFEVRLRHEFGAPGRDTKKYVNLQFPGKADRLEALRDEIGLLPDDRSIYLVKAGGALAVRIDTPTIDPRGEHFESQRSKLLAAIEAMKRLISWLQQNQLTIERLLS